MLLSWQIHLHEYLVGQVCISDSWIPVTEHYLQAELIFSHVQPSFSPYPWLWIVWPQASCTLCGHPGLHVLIHPPSVPVHTLVTECTVRNNRSHLGRVFWILNEWAPGRHVILTHLKLRALGKGLSACFKGSTTPKVFGLNICTDGIALNWEGDWLQAEIRTCSIRHPNGTIEKGKGKISTYSNTSLEYIKQDWRLFSL